MRAEERLPEKSPVADLGARFPLIETVQDLGSNSILRTVTLLLLLDLAYLTLGDLEMSGQEFSGAKVQLAPGAFVHRRAAVEVFYMTSVR